MRKYPPTIPHSFSSGDIRAIRKESPRLSGAIDDALRLTDKAILELEDCDANNGMVSLVKAARAITKANRVAEEEYADAHHGVLQDLSLSIGGIEDALQDAMVEFTKRGCECFNKTGRMAYDPTPEEPQTRPHQSPIIDADARRAWSRQKTPRRRHMY